MIRIQMRALLTAMAALLVTSCFLTAYAASAEALPVITSPSEGQVLDTAKPIIIDAAAPSGQNVFLQVCTTNNNQPSVVVGSRCSDFDNGPNGSGTSTGGFYEMTQTSSTSGVYRLAADLRPGSIRWPFALNVFLRAVVVPGGSQPNRLNREFYGPGTFTNTMPTPVPGFEASLWVERDAVWGTQIQARFSSPSNSTPIIKGVSINDGAVYTNRRQVTLRVEGGPYLGFVPVDETFVIANDGGYKNSTPIVAHPLATALETDGTALSIPWTLQSSGAERLPKTVYVKDLGTDDIILDETLPVIASAGFVGSKGANVSANPRSYRIKLRASDKTSGVALAQVATDKLKKKLSVPQKYSGAITVKATSKPLWVRVQDRAGNFSKWKKLP